MIAFLSRFFATPEPAIEPATDGDSAVLARLHGESFHRGWGESDFAQMLREKNTMLHRLRIGSRVVGFAVSRLAADEAEILSVAIEKSQRGRGLSRDLLHTHLGHLAGRGVRVVFLEVEENNQPARRLYERAGFATVSRRARYYREENGAELNALVMRRDLS